MQHIAHNVDMLGQLERCRFFFDKVQAIDRDYVCYNLCVAVFYNHNIQDKKYVLRKLSEYLPNKEQFSGFKVNR